MFYRIDAANRIVEVSPEWDDFARVNDGKENALSSTVVGRPLDDFLAGDATRMFVRAAIDAARLLSQPRVLPYRCDSPTQRRRFEMHISADAQGSVTVTHCLVDTQPRPARLHHRTAIGGWRCSQCLSVRLPGGREWISADALTTSALAQDICPACAGRLFNLKPRLSEPSP
jgi:hypothetical protein